MKAYRIFRYTLLSLCLYCIGTTTLQAQEDGLVLRYNFENVSGTSVPDATGSSVSAKLMNQAKVVEMGKFHVLDLGSGTGYLDMSSAAGDLFKSSDNFTISLYYKVDATASLSGNGFFLWSFSTSTACAASSGKYFAYRLNAQRFATSTGGYNNEVGFELTSASEKGRWIHVVYRQSGTTGSLYLDGVFKGSQTGMPLNSTNFTSSVPYVWIGRAPFSGDSYLTKTLISDFRLYNKALTVDEIKTLAGGCEELEYEYRYGTPGDFTSLTTAIQDAEEFLSTAETAYPLIALEEYKDEINMAKTLVDEGRVNQDIIDEQITALTTAQTKLKRTAGFVFDDSNTTEGYQTERGFKHPGALHTQADFDRIKSQLTTNSKVKSAYNVLKSAEYSQSTTVSYPVETIVRGGGVGENYINAARAATMAYQNALRWKIDGTTDNANRAVLILNAWAQTTKAIGGDSNYALASGLYGYQFANAAELMRDYEGWAEADFEAFKKWMLDVWYPPCIGFLRGRNGTWENASRWWQCPGHYWSNWGLCNALAVISIGILCDDVFIYNQGMSYYKYDQVGTFTDPRTVTPILNDGLTEFIGNLVVTTSESELETGAYGKLGQMQESGRDIGHATMAAGLAVDIAHIGWNQGDDLFSYMDNRLAAGIEYIAAQTQSVEGLPWTNYHYGESGLHWSDGRTWIQTGPALGEQIRPYWGTVIGHYEGVKGVEMPFSKTVYNKMGIDGGGTGSTSGGYDHLGYSVLMNTYNGTAEDTQVPTLLTPKMKYNGVTIAHNELGGLKNTYQTNVNTGLAKGTIVELIPQLPEGAEDTGLWKWNTGATTKDITITADNSYIYRVEYTNSNGVKSEQMFAIAVAGDCEEMTLTPHITCNGTTTQTNSINVMYGAEVKLTVDGIGGFGTYLWENGQTSNSITIPNITTSRDISVIFTNQGGRKQKETFHINVSSIRPDFSVNNTVTTDSEVVLAEVGDSVTLQPVASQMQNYGTWKWDNGEESATLILTDIQTSDHYTVSYLLNGEVAQTLTYKVYVKDPDYLKVENGDYYIHHTGYDLYLTKPTGAETPIFAPLNTAEPLTQQWNVAATSTSYSMMSLSDSTYLLKTGLFNDRQTKVFRFNTAINSDLIAIRNNTREGNVFWDVTPDGDINFAAYEAVKDYHFKLIPVAEGPNDIRQLTGCGASIKNITYYNINGTRLQHPQKGINLCKVTYTDGKTEVKKIIVR